MGIVVVNSQRLLKIDRRRLHRNASFWLDSLSSLENEVSLAFVRDNRMKKLNFQYRGIDETTAMQLADSGIKIGDLKKIDKAKLIENYGLKPDIADGVIDIITAGPQSHGKERYLSKVLAPQRKKPSKIKELK